MCWFNKNVKLYPGSIIEKNRKENIYGSLKNEAKSILVCGHIFQARKIFFLQMKRGID